MPEEYIAEEFEYGVGLHQDYLKVVLELNEVADNEDELDARLEKARELGGSVAMLEFETSADIFNAMRNEAKERLQAELNS